MGSKFKIVLLILIFILNIVVPMGPTSVLADANNLIVTYLDVGQADSTLIQLPNNEIMLVDAGNNDDGDSIVEYLRNEKISKINYLIATHPHEDHIGGMVKVIESFDIGNIYMPKATNNTITFEDTLTAIQNKGLKIYTASAGQVILDDENNLAASFVGPVGDSYDNLNNYSAVIRLVYGHTSFLFAGDAEDVAEREILNKGYNIKADVLKVGHHGSNTSTHTEFLSRINPKYAVISCGKDNQYGHPAPITIESLKKNKIEIFRTDIDGTIMAISDAESINFKTTKSNNNTTTPNPTSTTTVAPTKAQASEVPVVNQSSTVYLTKTGAKYHADGCRHLAKSKIPVSLSDAKNKGYTPCSVCKPSYR